MERAIAQNELRYPVAQDNDYATWDAWGNQYWPAKYLIDARGRVRYAHFGEGDYDKTESAIRALLAEAGRVAARGRPRARRSEIASTRAWRRPETYLELPSGPRTSTRRCAPGTGSYAGATELPPVHFALAGTWKRHRASRRPRCATRAIDARVTARKVFLVLGTERRAPARGAGAARRQAAAGRRGGRGRERRPADGGRAALYRLVSLPRVEDRRLTVKLPPGVSGYAFTFG